MQSVRKRLLNGLGANGFGQAVNLLIQIASVPLFLHFWGIKLYGEWLILSTIPAYLAMSDLGFASVSGNRMTMQVAASNRDAALATFQSAWMLLCAACFLCLALASATFFLPLNTWLQITTIPTEKVSLIILTLCIVVVVNLQSSMLHAGFRCDGNYALGAWLTNLIRLIEFGLVAIGLLFGIEPLGVAITYVVIRSFGLIVTRHILKKKSPWIGFGYQHATFKNIREMARPSLAFMAFPVGNALKNQGLLTVVGITLGPAMVVAFSTMRTIVNSAQQAMTMINSSVWPEMSRAFGSGDIDLARKLHRFSCKTSFWLALFFLCFLALFADQIINAWTLGMVSLDPAFFNLMLLVILFNSFWFTSSVALVAINQHEKMALIYSITSFCIFLLAILLTPMLGLPGLALCLLLLEFVMALFVTKNSLILVEDNPLKFLLFVVNIFPAGHTNRRKQ